MRAYYLEGDNIEWLIGVPDPFVIGVVGALAMFVIPEKINLRVCRANVFSLVRLWQWLRLSHLSSLPVGHSRWMSWKPGDTGKMTVNSLRQTFRRAHLPNLLINWIVPASSLIYRRFSMMSISASGGYISVQVNSFKFA